MKKKGKNMLTELQIQKLWALFQSLNVEQQHELSKYVAAIDIATDINPDLIRDAVSDLIQKYPELKDVIEF